MSLWIRIALLALASVPIWGWSHVSGTELREHLGTQDHTLVASSGQSQLLDAEWPNVAEADDAHLSIDCETESKFCENHDVRSFPAIRLYRSGGEVYDHYRGPRLASKIKSFVKRSLRPAVSGLGAENVTDFSSIDDYVFVLHLTDADAGKGLYKRFHDLAMAFRDRYSFGVVPAEHQDGGSTLECYNSLDEVKRSTQDLVEDFNSLKSFFEICTNRLVPEMTRENKRYFTEGTGNVLYYFGSYSDDRARFSSSLRETVRKHIKDLEFVTVDPVVFPEVLANVGLKWDFPAMALQDKTRGLVFPSEKNEYITSDMVENFLRSFKDGNASPSFWDPVERRTEDGDMNVDTSSEETATHDEL
ncbi:thioredoxin-like domain-containing protein [Colletotrichum cereale]|nr:thioredoxin-like domain-containing protein [Colletotrichum cereale]